MENNEESHYVTEKIINGFRAGVIPVYWGSPNIHRYFHKDRFLSLPNDSIESIKTLVNQMLTMTNEEYMRRVNLPIFKDGFGLENVVEDAQQCITAVSECINQLKRPTFDIKNEQNVPVDTEKHESAEQDLAFQYILSDDVVLELGARYGSVSCMINYKLKSKTHQVVIEPDERVWDALERNKLVNKCEFQIVKGFLSAKKLALTELDKWYGGYAATSVEAPDSKIPSYSLSEIEERSKLKFNVLVADCEGFLETFFNENPTFVKQLRLIIFEADYAEKCNYAKIRSMLKSNGFNELLNGHQNVWKR
jgi:FkbM family methyltransferase